MTDKQLLQEISRIVKDGHELIYRDGEFSFADTRGDGMTPSRRTLRAAVEIFVKEDEDV